MPRIFNIEIFDDNLEDPVDHQNDQDLNEILGRADQLNFQITITQVSGTSPVLTAKLQMSNDGRYWNEHTVLLNAIDISSPPYHLTAISGTGTLGAFARLNLLLAGTNPAAHIRVNVCGRTSG